MLNLQTDWFSAAVANASRGLRAAATGEFRFMNFIKIDHLLKVIAKGPMASNSPIYLSAGT